MAEGRLTASAGWAGFAPVDLGPGVVAGFTGTDFDLATAQGQLALASRLKLPLVFAQQVHGTRLTWVGARPAGQTEVLPATDALATWLSGCGLVIRTADCLPVLLADGAAGLVAAVHAGWRGLVSGILPAAVAALRAAGANDLQAAVGPGICGRCYEVGPEVADQARAAGHVLTPGRGDRWQLDLAASAQRQLAGLGVAPVQVAGACTATTPGLYSYRAQAAAGRQGGVIAIGG